MLPGSGLPSTPEKRLENTATIFRQLANLTLTNYSRLHVTYSLNGAFGTRKYIWTSASLRANLYILTELLVDV